VIKRQNHETTAENYQTKRDCAIIMNPPPLLIINIKLDVWPTRRIVIVYTVSV